MGKTRDLLKKIRDSKGTFHAKMSTIKDRNGKTDIVCAHLYVECKKVKLTSTRQWDGGYLGLGGGEVREMLVEGWYRF